MDLQGKIIQILPERSGSSARGEWKVGEFVMETIEQFPKRMVFSVWGADRLSRFNIQQGQDVHVFFDINAREYNGKWYNSVQAYDVRPFDPTLGTPPVQGAETQPFPPASPAPAAPTSPTPAPSSTPTAAAAAATLGDDINAGGNDNPDDLPF
ncbi:MAG: DUF3127 domain-containing protein [Prevotella sp.]|nr:DUF3127 domain-containing protein [Prevotella sp.]